MGFESVSQANCRDTGKKCWAFDIALENAGNTPALEETHRLNGNGPLQFKKLPKGFTYPDNPLRHGAFGNMPVGEAPAILEPRSRVGTGAITVPEEVLQAVNDGTKYVYFWGWINYKDAFGCEHRTEFCQEIVFVNLPTTFGTANCFEHNCIDSTCPDYKPTPNDLCSTVIPK